VRTAIVATVEPFFTAILGLLILQSQLTAATLIGGILIAGAILLIQWHSSQLAPTAQL
jgi:drug/metabolite transporter (DMT)-like permease